jgi:hypothetical protein
VGCTGHVLVLDVCVNELSWIIDGSPESPLRLNLTQGTLSILIYERERELAGNTLHSLEFRFLLAFAGVYSLLYLAPLL